MDSDPDIEFVERNVDLDSGMSSLGNSKDETPERKPNETTIENEQNTTVGVNQAETFDDEPDESLFERLWGLSEMFPEPLRNVCGAVSDFSTSSVKNIFQFSCNASWIFFTSSMILFAPVIFETERAQMEEMQRSQQKQVLLGPGAMQQMPPGGSSGMPALPPMAR